jgi:hypothetical protein
VAPEAGQDVVYHHPSKLPPFGLEARKKSGLQESSAAPIEEGASAT